MKLENAKPKINHLYEEIVSNDAAEMSVSNGFSTQILLRTGRKVPNMRLMKVS